MPQLLKPFQLGALLRPVPRAGRVYSLGVSVLASWSLDAPDALLPEPELWRVAAEQLAHVGGVVDVGVPKRGAEAIVVGDAYAPGASASTCVARVRVGAIDKSVAVIGDRRWRRGVPTAPAPFERMPLGFSRAFGGEGFLNNPDGLGFRPSDGAPLPNLEHPDHLIEAPDDVPAPVQLGPVDITWPQRASLAGTYDQAWFERDYPCFPADIDWGYFNLAPRDQQAPAPFAGGEAVTLEGVHPTRARIESRLPDHRVLALVKRAGGADERLNLALSTVWLFPGCLRAIGVWHGGVPVAEEDARDVERVTIAAEGAAAPRSEAHYAQVITARLDRSESTLAMQAWVDDTPLLPPGHRSIPKELLRSNAVYASPNHALRRRHAGQQRKMERARARVRELGVDPDALGLEPLPDMPAPATLRDLPRLMEEGAERSEAARALADEKHAAARAREAELLTGAGMDPELLDRARAGAASGPPKLDLEAHREKLRGHARRLREAGGDASFLDAMIDGPDAERALADTDRALKDGYRMGAHAQSPIPPLAARERLARRERLLARLRDGRSVAELDLSGADLRGLDLRGADLSRAWLESADLRDARLSGAQLTEAVLTRALFAGASLSGAALREANLGETTIGDCDLSGADLQGAVLSGARFERVRLAGARLTHQVLNETSLIDCDLSGAWLDDVTLLKTTLTGCRFAAVHAARARFLECDLSSLDFSRADLTAATLLDTRADAVDLTGARLGRLVGVRASLRSARLDGARMTECNLRGCALDAASLREARLDRADLSEATLEGADLGGASARHAMMMRTGLAGASLQGADLMEANLYAADLRGADLGGASLYGADLAMIRGDDATSLAGADQTRVRARPMRIHA